MYNVLIILLQQSGREVRGGSWVLYRVGPKASEYNKYMKCDLFSGLAQLKNKLHVLSIISLVLAAEENI